MYAMQQRDGSCWRCDDRVGLAPACTACNAPQPVSAHLDLFAVLGVPRSLVVDVGTLERCYHDLARRLHPDRHQATDVRALELAVQATAALNRAYRTLRDPVARGRYWLELYGRPLGADNNRVPPALAALVFDVQEQLEALRVAPDADDARAAVLAARADVQARLAGELQALEESFTACAEPTDDETLGALKRRLTDVAYLRTLLGDIDAVLEP
jgi:molecular chaperone HscB